MSHPPSPPPPPPPLPESAISGDVNAFTSCVCQLDPTQTHTRDCVNRWCKRGQKGQYFQTEYVISNRCGGKKMVMNKARHAAEKGVRAARSRAVGRELIALTVPYSTGEENGHGLPATALVPRKAGRAQLLDSPAPRSRWRWCPRCPFIPRIIAARFPAAPPKALRKGAWPLGSRKAILASCSSRGAGRPGHQQRRCSQLLLPAHLGRGEKHPRTAKPKSMVLT